MRIAQITDSHIVGPGSLWKGRVDTAARLAEAVDALNRIGPDLVVHTGDVTETGTEAEARHAASLLAALRAPLRLIPGNHDRRSSLRAAFPGQNWPATLALTFAERHQGLNILGLDTVREGETAGTFAADQGAWLSATLRDAPGPALLFAHHPPCAMDLPFMDVWPFEGETTFAGSISGANVLRIATGHVHAAADLHWQGTLVSTCPALSVQIPPEQAPGPAAGWVDAPGALRLFDWQGGRLSVKLVPLTRSTDRHPFRE